MDRVSSETKYNDMSGVSCLGRVIKGWTKHTSLQGEKEHGLHVWECTAWVGEGWGQVREWGLNPECNVAWLLPWWSREALNDFMLESDMLRLSLSNTTVPTVQRRDWRGLDLCRKWVKRLLSGKSDGGLDEPGWCATGDREMDKFEIYWEDGISSI